MYYITKYALTRGIVIVPDEDCEVVREGHVLVVNLTDYNSKAYFNKPFWHPTLEEAQAHAQIMCDKKIKSLNKQIKKLSKPIEFISGLD